MAYLITHGVISTDKKICHKCDNPPCCNPAHLFEGTDLDNALDCIEKGRKPIGSNCVQALLNEREVLEIRKKYSWRKYHQFKLAKEYGVSRSAIQSILERRNWKHLTKPM